MQTTERRRERRQVTYLGAEVAYNRRSSAMDCLVRNMAPSGALVDLRRQDAPSRGI